MPHFFQTHLAEYLSFLRRHNALPVLVFYRNLFNKTNLDRSILSAMTGGSEFGAFHSRSTRYSSSMHSHTDEGAGHGRGRMPRYAKRFVLTSSFHADNTNSRHSKSYKKNAVINDLPVHPYPAQTSDEIKSRLPHLVRMAKTQWLENPKNVVFVYMQSRFGTYPDFVCRQGHYPGKQQKICRSTIQIDEEFGIVATGDGKSQKESEKAAALHGMLLLLERDFIANPPPGIFGSGAKGHVKVLEGELADGTRVSLEQAREFVDYFTRENHLGPPDVAVSEAHEFRRHRVLFHGWRAVMNIGGTPIGQSFESNKKTAQNAACVNTAVILANEDRETWEQFLRVPKSKLAGKAPPVSFYVSSMLGEKMRNLYDLMRNSDLYANRPRTTATFSSTFKRTRSTRSKFSEGRHAEKSMQMLERLNAYHADDSIRPIRISRESLPVTQHAGDVLVKVERNPVTICMASTGSGKTTQVPQILLDDFILRQQGSRCNIVCTQPRRIAAISVAQRVAKERGESLGDTVGYQVRFESKLPKPNGSILFCTTGVFLRRLQSALEGQSSDSFLDDVTHILVDEIHERDVETDLFLAVIRRVLWDRRQRGCAEIKLVLMSATVDPKPLKEYFEKSSLSPRPVPVIEIPGRSFPVKKFYLDDTIMQLQGATRPFELGGWVWKEKSVSDYLHRELVERGGDAGSMVDNLELPYPLIALMIAHVVAMSDDGHILVFLPGWDEIKIVHQLLMNTREMPLMGLHFDDVNQFEVHILHSSVPVADQQAVFEPLRNPQIRRIILATNIAETSVTIPDVVYVVDTGRVKEKRYDPERHLSSLVLAWVGTSNLNQRAGRAGRHRSGEYYGLLSKAHYDKLSVQQTVEMKRLDLSNVVMHIKALNIPGMDVEDVLASTMEPPEPDRVKAAMADLAHIGALDFNRRLTSLGQMLLQLPVDVYIGKMCLFGAFFRCLDPALTLAAILTNRDPFMAPMHLKKEANAIKDSWCPNNFRSDPLCILNAFDEWSKLQSFSSSQANHFLYQNMLNRVTMVQIQQVKESLFQSLEKANVFRVIKQSNTAPARFRRRVRITDKEFNIHASSTALLSAMIAVSLSNFAVRTGERSYRTSQDKSCFLHLSSVCHPKFLKDKSISGITTEREIIVYAEKVRNTSQCAHVPGNALTFLRVCTRIDPLTFMLFGAKQVLVSSRGLECDGWLPVIGDFDALDGVERIKVLMDACILCVLDRIRSPAFSPLSSTKSSAVLSGLTSDQHGSLAQHVSYDCDNSEAVPLTPQPLSLEEVEEFESFSAGIVDLLDHYTAEFYGGS